MSKTSLAHRLRTLNQIYVHTQLARHMLSFSYDQASGGGRQYVGDKLEEHSRQLSWLLEEINVIEIALGIADD